MISHSIERTGTRAVRVLHVLADTIDGGAQRMVAALLPRLDEGRVASSVVSLRGERDTDVERQISAVAPVHHLDKSEGFDPRAVIRLRRLIRTVRPDVLHTHRIVVPYVMAALGLKRIGWVHTVHSAPTQGDSRLGRLMLRGAIARGAHLVAVGGVIERDIRRLYPRAQLVETVWNGIPIPESRPSRETRARIRQALGVPDGAFVVVCVARLNVPKNQQMLVEATEKLNRADVRVLLVGDGPHRERLQALIDEKGLRGQVLLLGQRDDVPALLAASDVFALTSDWEGTPLSILEALVSGLPVVSTRVGSVPELVDDGTTGLLCAPGDADGLASAMARLASDRERTERMGQAAASHGRQAFDIARMVSRYQDIYLLHARSAGDQKLGRDNR